MRLKRWLHNDSALYLELSLLDEDDRECLRLLAGGDFDLRLFGGGDLRRGDLLRPLPERLRRRDDTGDRRLGLGEPRPPPRRPPPPPPPRLFDRRLRGLGEPRRLRGLGERRPRRTGEPRPPPPRRDGGEPRRGGAGRGIKTGAAVISWPSI